MVRTMIRENEINRLCHANATTPDQPIEADDVLVGGEGRGHVLLPHADQRQAGHHPAVMSTHDGTINWGMNGVAGENDNVHDHWVDGIGHDVIWDFSRKLKGIRS